MYVYTVVKMLIAVPLALCAHELENTGESNFFERNRSIHSVHNSMPPERINALMLQHLLHDCFQNYFCCDQHVCI